MIDETGETMGEVLRHACPLPLPKRGLIWRCKCGRRWKVSRGVSDFKPGQLVWRRRYLPWNGSTP